MPYEDGDDVCAMLDAQRIAFYETSSSIWGVSAGGIRIAEDAAFSDARRSMDDYQQQRSARAEYAEAKKEGTSKTFLTMLRTDPAASCQSCGILVVLAVLAVVAMPVILLPK